MKRIVALITFAVFASQTAFAGDKCLPVVEKSLARQAALSSAWGFEGLQAITRASAQEQIDHAYWDMNDQETLQKAKVLLAQPEALFYNLFWTAPSNSGVSVIVVDAKTCKELLSVGISSEE